MPPCSPYRPSTASRPSARHWGCLKKPQRAPPHPPHQEETQPRTPVPTSPSQVHKGPGVTMKGKEALVTSARLHPPLNAAFWGILGLIPHLPCPAAPSPALLHPRPCPDTLWVLSARGARPGTSWCLSLPSSGDGPDFCIGSAGSRCLWLGFKAEQPGPGEPGRSGWEFSAGSQPLRSASPSGVSLNPSLGTGGEKGHPNISPTALQGSWSLGKWFCCSSGRKICSSSKTQLGWVTKRAGGECALRAW